MNFQAWANLIVLALSALFVSAVPTNLDNALHDLHNADLAAENVAEAARVLRQKTKAMANDLTANNNKDASYPVGDMMKKLTNAPEIDDMKDQFKVEKSSLATPHPNAAEANPQLKDIADRMMDVAERTQHTMQDLNKQGDLLHALGEKYPKGLDEVAAGQMRDKKPMWLSKEEDALSKSATEFKSIAKSELQAAQDAESVVKKLGKDSDSDGNRKADSTAEQTNASAQDDQLQNAEEKFTATNVQPQMDSASKQRAAAPAGVAP